MDGLLSYPLAPWELVALYAGVCLLTVAGCWWLVRRADPTRGQPPPPVPAAPDPYELAYLRGGENEVTRTAIFRLLERGYLHTTLDWLARTGPGG